MKRYYTELNIKSTHLIADRRRLLHRERLKNLHAFINADILGKYLKTVLIPTMHIHLTIALPGSIMQHITLTCYYRSYFCGTQIAKLASLSRLVYVLFQRFYKAIRVALNFSHIFTYKFCGRCPRSLHYTVLCSIAFHTQNMQHMKVGIKVKNPWLHRPSLT